MRTFLTLGLFLMLGACESTTQVTSGEEYMRRHGGIPDSLTKQALKADGTLSFEEKLRQAASVEPTLKFPARIGIARIHVPEYGAPELSIIPPSEAAEWAKFAENREKDFGSFIPLNPMIAAMFTDTADESKRETYYRSSPEALIKDIRLAAARQHLDAILIYEVVTKRSHKDNLLSLGKATIVGGFILPSKTIEAEGYASAMLIDVMQAYPYGTAQAYADDLSSLSSAWGWGDKYDEALTAKIEETAVGRLTIETGKMLDKLLPQLAEAQARAAANKQAKTTSSKKPVRQ